MIEVRAETYGRTWHDRFVEVAAPSIRKANALRYHLRLQTLTTWLATPAARDLAKIAIAVHLSDRQIRRSLRSGHRPRQMSVTLSVEEPERWEPQRPLLEELASFATQDTWTISFRAGATKRVRQIQPPDEVPPTIIALFSGGLDSLCGAAYLADRGERVGLLTHSPPGAATVQDLVDPLPARSSGGKPSSYQLLSLSLRPLQCDEHGSRRYFQEFSRRSRPFFYLALASAAAIGTGADRVQMSENGALGASLPIRRSHYGGFMTRQGHSYLMAGFETLLRAAVPECSSKHFENPFSQMTKGEACRYVRASADLARRTLSCEYAGQQIARLHRWVDVNGGRRPSEFRQCGICVPCLVRRAAMRAAAIADPNTDYFFQAPKVLRALRTGRSLFGHGSEPPLYNFANGHCLYMARFAEELSAMKVDDFTVQYLPELRSLRPALVTRGEIKAAFDLQRRFAKEILEFLNG